MFTTILVPLDGSERAEAALPVAARIARHTGATLFLLRVVSLAAESFPATMTTNPLLAEAMIETDLAEARAYLERVATSPLLAGIVSKTAVDHGLAASTILEASVEAQSELIVLCRRGASGLTRWAMGSIAAKVARHATVPVLVVPEASLPLGVASMDQAQPLKLLIPLDGSTLAQAALEPGTALLTALAAPGQSVALQLVQVIPPPHSKTKVHARESAAVFQAQQAMHHTVTLLQQGSLAPLIARHQIPVTWSVLLDADVASALLRVVEPGNDTEGATACGECHLIAISTHGRGGLQRRVMGSITERVLSATTRPVLIVRPGV